VLDLRRCAQPRGADAPAPARLPYRCTARSGLSPMRAQLRVRPWCGARARCERDRGSAAGLRAPQGWVSVRAPVRARRARRCLRRGEELRLPHLAAYARLALARFALQHRLAPPEAHQRAERALPAPELGAPSGLARPSSRLRAPPVFNGTTARACA